MTSTLEQLIAERMAGDVLALVRELTERQFAQEQAAREDTARWRIRHWRELGALSLDETAQVLGVSEPTVRRLIDDKALESVQGLGAGSRRTVPVLSIRRYLREV